MLDALALSLLLARSPAFVNSIGAKVVSLPCGSVAGKVRSAPSASIPLTAFFTPSFTISLTSKLLSTTSSINDMPSFCTTRYCLPGFSSCSFAIRLLMDLLLIL